MSETEKLVIKVADIKEYLANGTTRLKSDKNYHPDRKSIEEIYNLSTAEVRDLFREESLKGIRTVAYVPKRWTLVDEEENSAETADETTSENNEEASSAEEVNEPQEEPQQEERSAEERNIEDSF